MSHAAFFGRFSNFDKYRQEAASDVISSTFVRPIALDKSVKFRDPCLNRSPEIPPEAVGGGIFCTVFSL